MTVKIHAKDLHIEASVALAYEEFHHRHDITLLIGNGRRSLGIYQEVPMKVYSESKYLKHQDLDGQDMVLTIANVTRENIKEKDGSDKKKFILYFREVEKGLVLNSTNMNTLYAVLKSDESDEWIGKRITLYEKDDVEFGGKLVSAIRIRPKAPL